MVGIGGYFLWQPKASLACEFDPLASSNWWFIQSYEFDQALLPEGIQIEVVYDNDPSMGELRFDLNRAGNTYMLGIFEPSTQEAGYFHGRDVSENFIKSKTRQITLTYEVGRRQAIQYSTGPDKPFRNSEQPFISERPIPEPHTLHLLIVHDMQIHEIPFVVSYTHNPFFSEKTLTHAYNINDLVTASDVIISGIALATDHPEDVKRAKEKEEWVDGYVPQLVYGEATIQVGGWLKGNGAEEVVVSNFGDGAGCREELELNEPMIFFVEKRANHLQLVGTTTYDIPPKPYTKSEVQQILHLTDQNELATSFTEDFQAIVEAKENGKPFPLNPAPDIRNYVLIGIGILGTLAMLLLSIKWWRA